MINNANQPQNNMAAEVQQSAVYTFSGYVEQTQESVVISESSISIDEEETYILTASVPTDPNREVTWSSSDTDVATVKDGVVTGVAAGTATITAAAGNLTATCTVTVTGEEVEEEITENTDEVE